MKRIISVILCCLLVIMCGGCDKSNEPVTLTVLTEDGNSASYEREFIESMQDLVNYVYPNEKIVLEGIFLKKDPLERQSQLTQLRTEIMAGKGPDIFMLPTWDVTGAYGENGEALPEKEPLFREVESAMRNGTFLPLDDMIAESEHLNIEDHIEVIMNAGCTEEGQVLLPMYFTYYLAPLEASGVDDTVKNIDSFDELAECENELLLNSLGNAPNWTSFVFADLFDPDTDKLIITEDELTSTLKKIVETRREGSTENISYDMRWDNFDDIYLYSINSAGEDAYIFAMPNTSGGITAQITAYTAINRNCAHPEEAFKVIELFFDEEMQTKGKIQSKEDNKLYTFVDAIQFGAYEGVKTSKAIFEEDNLYNKWEEFQSIHARINSVRFSSEIDCMLNSKWSYFFDKIYSDEAEQIDFDAVAAELYSDWKMMVAE